MILRGDRVDSTYGLEHRGEVVGIETFRDGKPYYKVKRDSDGFVWFGWDETVTPIG